MAFKIWNSYWGELEDGSSSKLIFRLQGYENFNHAKTKFNLLHTGCIWGYVQEGAINLKSKDFESLISKGKWFTHSTGKAEIELLEKTKILLIQKPNYRGMNLMGGPLEEKGRLNYIDGCSDTLLCPPLLKGEPCLNHLHFPSGIDQTMHTHPSARLGIVAKGSGICISDEKKYQLEEGMIFIIPENTQHKFRTSSDDTLDIVSYHPDSDWGPTHHEHPMLNRTWVGGKKIDNSSIVPNIISSKIEQDD
jgi:hypothetical protein